MTNTLNKDQRKILAMARKHFKSRDAREALILLTEHSDPALWAVFREGLAFDPNHRWLDFRGALKVTGGEIQKRVRRHQRIQVALHAARHNGLLDDVKEMFFFEGNALWDLSPLADLTLTRLCINGLRMCEDFSPLGRLPAMTDLEIRGASDLSDASLFASLHKLQRLFLFECGVTDLTPLANMTQLKRLIITTRASQRGEMVSDLTPLRGMSALLELHLHCASECGGLDDLTFFPHLQKLGLAGVGVREIPDLSALSDLSELRIYDADLSDLTPLAPLTELRSLDLSNVQYRRGDNHTPIHDLNALAGMTKLERLNLSEVPDLNDISSLSGMTELRELTLKHCFQLTDLTPLKGLHQLRTLRLSNLRQLSDLSPLAGLHNLREVSIDPCHAVTDLSPVQSLPNLERPISP